MGTCRLEASSERVRIPRAVPLLLAVALSAGLTAMLAPPSSASMASTTQRFCADVAGDGGIIPFEQAFATGTGAAGLTASLQKLDKVAPSKQLKSTVTTLEGLLKSIAAGEKVNELGAKDTAKLTSALSRFSDYVAAKCTPTTSASGNAATPSAMSGTWSGQYTGVSDGTFTLTWQQSGSDLTGSIMISDFGDSAIPINGKVTGNKISFGTVGTFAVTYTGTVSGDTMSGTYHTPAGDGTWNATKGT
jgi:hypothetical protein